MRKVPKPLPIAVVSVTGPLQVRPLPVNGIVTAVPVGGENESVGAVPVFGASERTRLTERFTSPVVWTGAGWLVVNTPVGLVKSKTSGRPAGEPVKALPATSLALTPIVARPVRAT